MTLRFMDMKRFYRRGQAGLFDRSFRLGRAASASGEDRGSENCQEQETKRRKSGPSISLPLSSLRLHRE